MATRVAIDPLTRIEGHLRIELESDGGVINQGRAWSEATQFRGIENILQNRDPRDAWAFAQRICGVCTTVHAVASITAVENAIGSAPPEQAILIRDMVQGSADIQDHVIHFYHLHALDWVDVADAVNADPADAVAFAQTIGSKWKGNTLERMTEVKNTVQSIVSSGQLSIFTGGYWGHPAYKLPAQANLMAVAHYLDALEFQRSMIRICTVFGGKNPHPNFLVGGMAATIDPNSSQSVNQVQINEIQGWVNDTLDFVENCYVPDALAIMTVYKEYFDIGASSPNYLATGALGMAYHGDPNKATSNLLGVKPGVIFDDNFTEAGVQTFDPTKIEEQIASSWYSYAEQNGQEVTSLPPANGETTVKYTGPSYPLKQPNGQETWLSDGTDGKYSWCKVPRYDGKPMQVGPIARVLMAYLGGDTPFAGDATTPADPSTKEIVDAAMQTIGITAPQLNSTGGRTLARAVEALTAARWLAHVTFPTFVANLQAGKIDVFDASKWEPSSWAQTCSGYSCVEVARGMLSHWVTIKDKKIASYQCVVPSTWMAGGRDGSGTMGPYEQSLAGDGKHPLVDPTKPLEPLRTIHSYDPCLSCAVHVLDPDGTELQVVATS